MGRNKGRRKMLGNVSNIVHSMAAFTTRRSSAVSPPSPDVSIDRNAPMSFRLIEPESAQLYLANGLLAGETAPGGAGSANRIKLGEEDIAISGKPIFPTNPLPMIPTRETRLIEKMNATKDDTGTIKQSLVNWNTSTASSISYMFGGSGSRAVTSYESRQEQALLGYREQEERFFTLM